MRKLPQFIDKKPEIQNFPIFEKSKQDDFLNLESSGSQICSSCYPNQGSNYVLHPQHFAVIVHNTEKHYGFGSVLSIVLCNVFTPTCKALDFKHASQ